MSKIALLVFTDGQVDLLIQSLASAETNIQCEFAIKWIINDEPAVDTQLREKFLGYKVLSAVRRRGYCFEIQNAWLALPDGITHIFHLEQDFTFNEPIPVNDMISVLDREPMLAQMALVRQPVNDIERKAGSILKAMTERYVQRDRYGFTWLESNFCFTNNPCVYPVHVTKFPYPIRNSWPWGEGEFSELLRAKGYVFGYWGGWEQTPKVTHNG